MCGFPAQARKSQRRAAGGGTACPPSTAPRDRRPGRCGLRPGRWRRSRRSLPESAGSGGSISGGFVAVTTSRLRPRAPSVCDLCARSTSMEAPNCARSSETARPSAFLRRLMSADSNLASSASRGMSSRCEAVVRVCRRGSDRGGQLHRSGGGSDQITGARGHDAGGPAPCPLDRFATG